jgi:hypothetical protein
MYENYYDTTINKLMYYKIIVFDTCFYVNETTIYFSLTTSHMFVGSNFQLEVNHVENLDHEGFYLLDQITSSLLLTIYNKSCYVCQYVLILFIFHVFVVMFICLFYSTYTTIVCQKMVANSCFN